MSRRIVESPELALHGRARAILRGQSLTAVVGMESIRRYEPKWVTIIARNRTRISKKECHERSTVD
jgi:hypothetical protein